MEQEPLKRALVKDVCRATTAAPTYLPPMSFTVRQDDDTTLQFDMIDGGIAVNNPVGFSSGLFSSTFVNTSHFSKHT
jgi:patatin-like phospholipase/acyl hydrolase